MVNPHVHEVEQLKARCAWLEAESDRRAGVISLILDRDFDDQMVERAAEGLAAWWRENEIPYHNTDEDDHVMARVALAAALTVKP